MTMSIAPHTRLAITHYIHTPNALNISAQSSYKTCNMSRGLQSQRYDELSRYTPLVFCLCAIVDMVVRSIASTP